MIKNLIIKRHNIIKLTVIVLVSYLVFLGIILYSMQSNPVVHPYLIGFPKGDVVSYVSNTPVSYLTNFNFTIEPAYLDSGLPTGKKMNLSFDSTEIFEKTKNTFNSRIYESAIFGIQFLASSDETPGIEELVPQNSIIKNNSLDTNLFRIMAGEFFINEFKNNFSTKYNNFYYYTSSLAIGDGCQGVEPIAGSATCANRAIWISNKYPLRIYCGVNSDDSVEKCDEIVKNLVVTTPNNVQ